MPDITPRLLWQNWLLLVGTILTSSSEDDSFPVEWLTDPLRSKVWRSETGWNVVSGFNNKLDITEGVSGDATATITAGNYATGALMAAEVETQINVVATDNTWTCTYSSSTNKFTIGHDNVQTGGLEWYTGASAATSIGACLGYDTTADDTGAASYPADTVSYCSREWIKADLLTARDCTIGLILNSNISSSAIITLAGNSTDSWASPATTQTLVGNSTLAIKYFSATQTYRWWRFLISDVTNANGYISVGIPYVGSYTQPSPGFATPFTEEFVELSMVGIADQGASFQEDKNRAKSYDLRWPGLSNNERDKIKSAADHLKVGRPFFFSFDPQNTPSDTIYCRMTEGITVSHVPPSYWQIGMSIMEVLG